MESAVGKVDKSEVVNKEVLAGIEKSSQIQIHLHIGTSVFFQLNFQTACKPLRLFFGDSDVGDIVTLVTLWW